MSRCFPFPPPGYESKVRSDPVNLLEKEKLKEKKHKKDKRSKEKKEGKEKKDRDRTRDKNKEKKDRKAKQKDEKKNKDRDKDENTILDVRKIGLQAEGQNAEKLGESIPHVNEVKNCSNVDELHKRIRDEGAIHRMVENIVSSLHRREEGFDAAADKEGRSGNAMVEVIGKDKSRNNGLMSSAEKDANKTIGWKEKVKDKGKDDKKADIHSEKNIQEKRNKENDNGKHKDKKRHKAKEKHVNKHKQDDTLKENGQNGHVYSPNFQLLASDKDNEKCADADGITNKKRKSFEMNGFWHDVLPNKVLREASSHLHTENGRTSEASDVTTHSSISRIGKNYVEANKEHKINGFTGIHPSSVDSRHSVSVDTGQDGGASFKQPHPDTKYLSRIYTVPKLKELSEFDDQQWLFSSDIAHSKPIAMFEASDMPQVWNEVLRIESADVFALPYVIPY